MTTSKSFLLLALGVLALQITLPAVSLAATATSDAVASAAAATVSNAAVIGDAADDDLTRQALVNKAALELAIVDIESRQGVWGDELSEAYLDLGTALRTLERHDEAVEAFGKSLQSLRISAGLHDLRQIPILQALLASQQALANWDEVDSLHHLIHYISRKNPAAEPELRFQSLVQLSRWTRKATDDRLLSSSYRVNATAMNALYGNEIDYFQHHADYAGRHLHVAGLFLEQAEFEFAQARLKYEQPISEFQSTEQQRSFTTTQCQVVRLRNGSLAQICTTSETPNMNYYLQPSYQKNSEIRQHLREMKEDIINAFAALQEDTDMPTERNALLADVNRLTEDYNRFVTQNSK
jgi:tetratricopeptide (TPR) repeat protein